MKKIGTKAPREGTKADTRVDMPPYQMPKAMASKLGKPPGKKK